MKNRKEQMRKAVSRACKLAKDHREAIGLVADYFQEKYGMTHSDLNYDVPVDALEMGIATISFDELCRMFEEDPRAQQYMLEKQQELQSPNLKQQRV